MTEELNMEDLSKLREIAKIIDPLAFCDPILPQGLPQEDYDSATFMKEAHQVAAMAKARAILAPSALSTEAALAGMREALEEGWVLVPRQRLAAAVSTLLDAAADAGIGTREFANEIAGYLDRQALAVSPPLVGGNTPDAGSPE